jgi:hypothetical protein
MPVGSAATANAHPTWTAIKTPPALLVGSDRGLIIPYSSQPSHSGTSYSAVAGPRGPHS